MTAIHAIPPRTDELIARYVEGEITADEDLELAAALNHDDHAVRRVAELLRLDDLLDQIMHEERSIEAFLAAMRTRVTSTDSGKGDVMTSQLLPVAGERIYGDDEREEEDLTLAAALQSQWQSAPWYVSSVAQALSPKGGSFLVLIRKFGDGKVVVGIAHTDYDGPMEEPANMGLAAEVVLEEPGCPGRNRCHGCMKWCDECGDVEFTCDFPDCDVHPRLDELEEELRRLKEETARLARDWRYSEIATAEMQESVDRARRAAKDGQMMVPRPDP